MARPVLHRSDMTTAGACIIAALCGSACVSDEGDVEPGVISVDEDMANVTAAFAATPGDDNDTDNICSLLPADGPCALACDTGALAAQYVPSGTCAVFGCVLTDGRTIAVHACHPAD